ncbi:hypothetical protein RUM43_014745 [Polyplax serrata]|uniref:Mismatch repair endonuclease PMS2 n=1 Tax=Polyplax serrata TaxID=468196 RepID=A0AAN8NYY4_POLSC
MVRKGAATIMDTKGDSVISNIRAIFGIKQGQNLMQIIEKLPGSATLSEFGLENEVLDAERFKLDGYISSCAHGCGRAASDRQFYYINMRPVDNPKIGKLVNEMYHQFNNHQAPFVILNIKIAFGSFDVNVTPDKRQILIQNEKILLAILKESLISTFQNIPSTLEMQNVGILKHESKEEIGCIEKLKTNYTFSASQQSKRGESDRRIDKLLSLKLKSEITLTSKKRAALANSDKDDKVDDNENISFITPHNEIRISDKQNAIVHVDIPRPLPGNLKLYIKTESCKKDNFSEQTRHTKMPFENNNEIKRKLPSPQIFDVSYKEEKLESEEIESKRMKFDLGLSENEKNHRTTVILDVNLNGLTEMILKKKEQNERESKKNELMKFHAQIKRQSNEKAESELKRQIKKESFAQMEIIGQFNLGFIIVKLDTDIFVVDQHASDEKYNFETMRSNTVMQTQKMVVPETLELTVDKEELMVHRELVFKKNGFEFVFDETAVPTRRIKLTSIPLSKNVSFGKEDIDELLFLLEDAPEKVMLRPSRVESMFASRACRKSVMIGTPLNHNEMKKIVCQMGDIEQPWNCPHGRPTMRHLVNLGMIYTEK